MVVLVALTVAVFARGMKGIAVEVTVVDVGQAAEQAAGQPGVRRYQLAERQGPDFSAARFAAALERRSGGRLQLDP